MKKNHDYNVRFTDTPSLIEGTDMILLNEIWQMLPRRDATTSKRIGKLTVEDLRRVDDVLLEKIADDLTEMSKDPDGHMKHIGKVTPEDVAKKISFIRNDPNRSFLGNIRPQNVYKQIPSNKVPGTNVWRYGAVAGKWVPKEQYQHLTNWKEHGMEKLTRGRTANNMREVNNAWKGMHTVAAPKFLL